MGRRAVCFTLAPCVSHLSPDSLDLAVIQYLVRPESWLSVLTPRGLRALPDEENDRAIFVGIWENNQNVKLIIMWRV